MGTHLLGYCLGRHLPLVGQLVLQAFHLLLPLREVPLIHGGSRGLWGAENEDVGAVPHGCSLPRTPPPQLCTPPKTGSPRMGTACHHAPGVVSNPMMEQPMAPGVFGVLLIRQRLHLPAGMGAGARRCPLVAVPCPRAHAKPEDRARFDCNLDGSIAWGGKWQINSNLRLFIWGLGGLPGLLLPGCSPEWGQGEFWASTRLYRQPWKWLTWMVTSNLGSK